MLDTARCPARRFPPSWTVEVAADKKEAPLLGLKKDFSTSKIFLAVLLLTALLSAALLTTLAGLLVRLLLLLLAGLLLPAAALLATLAALLVLLILIGHAINMIDHDGTLDNKSGRRSNPTLGQFLASMRVLREALPAHTRLAQARAVTPQRL